MQSWEPVAVIKDVPANAIAAGVPARICPTERQLAYNGTG